MVLTLTDRRIIAELPLAGLKELEKVAADKRMLGLVEENKRVVKRMSEILEVIAKVKQTRKIK